MRTMQKQKGITLLGFVMILAIVGFFAFIIMRLFPVYSEYYGVVQALKAVQVEPGIASKTPEQIKESLDRKFYISYVTSVKKNNIKITRKDGGYLVQVKYEVRGPLLYNLEYIATFDKTVQLGGAAIGG
ncbi:MAG TPA: DUF4845 domain-containing protein [Xanthomonadales bacterium]|nr:DUF4845 domain-containing protein [Xanthomonadales bacterium]